MRLFTADLLHTELNPNLARLKYIFSFMALIDLFAILPFYLPFFIKFDLRILRALRIIRILRLFKVSRYTDALYIIRDVFKKRAVQLMSSLMIVLLLMLIASVLIYNFEHSAQPENFSNALAGFRWAITTLTAANYGERLFPITLAGKIFSTVFAILGIGIVAVPTGIISAGFIEHLKETDFERAMKKSASEMVLTVNDIEMLLYFNKLSDHEQAKEIGRIQQVLIDDQKIAEDEKLKV